MHYHCEVWVPKKDKWRSQVVSALRGLEEENDGFYDWYVIGGRWSGEHTAWLLRAKFGDKLEKISKEFEKDFGWWTNKDNDEAKRAKQYEEVFERHISKAEWDKRPLPGWRDTYKQDGFDDDIIAIEDVPWEAFTCYTFVLPARGKEYADARKYWHSEIWNGSTHQSSQYDVRKILAEHKLKGGYLVTVDYHS